MQERPRRPHRVDYDLVAPHYDERQRGYGVDPHLVALLETERRPEAGPFRILDVGCGTGKQLAADRERFPDSIMVGLDRFQGMLRIAKSRCPRGRWVQGDGAILPFVDAAFDYVTSQFSYQHVRRTPQFLSDAFRVLKPGGCMRVTNIDPWSMHGWLVYQFFPEALQADREDFLPVDAFVTEMERCGFRGVQFARTDLSRTQSAREFLAFACARHRASQLLTISDEAYASGIRRVEDVVARAPEALLTSEFVNVTFVGRKRA